MMNKQFFTNCRYCGKQILMTRSAVNGHYIPCDSEIVRFTQGGKKQFITPDGEPVMGEYAADGEVGYQKHSLTCKARRTA